MTLGRYITDSVEDKGMGAWEGNSSNFTQIAVFFKACTRSSPPSRKARVHTSVVSSEKVFPEIQFRPFLAPGLPESHHNQAHRKPHHHNQEPLEKHSILQKSLR